MTDAAVYDHRIPLREDCVARYRMDHWAREKPHETFVVFEDGERWTYFEFRRRTVALAAGLERLGVRQGDYVAAWLPNGREALLAQFAINYLGCVFVPFNTAYRGTLLQHVLVNSGATILIAHGSLVDRLAEVVLPGLKTVVVVGEGDPSGEFQRIAFEEISASEASPSPLARPIEPWDVQAIIFTSGTTGPSKGVITSYLHNYTAGCADAWYFVESSDRMLINMPNFHVGGMAMPFGMFVRGGSIGMMGSFSTERFWDVVRTTECTGMFLLGVMATFLMKQPPSPRDKVHKIRFSIMVPLMDDAQSFGERFRLDVYTIFNMTETSSPIVSEPNPSRKGTCGRKREGVDLRLVDENDCEVPIGAPGELIIRTDRPFAMNSGYNRDAEATAVAWRNGWFHTGDVFRVDPDGYYYFVDRVKDAIRRRGENISSFEVEAELTAHHAVREAAVIGVRSEYSEDEVLAVIAPVPGMTIDPIELTAFLQDRLAYFMVPRYLRIMPELPKTPTAKVQKAELRSQGLTADTWDREAAGIRLRREKLDGR